MDWRDGADLGPWRGPRLRCCLSWLAAALLAGARMGALRSCGLPPGRCAPRLSGVLLSGPQGEGLLGLAFARCGDFTGSARGFRKTRPSLRQGSCGRLAGRDHCACAPLRRCGAGAGPRARATASPAGQAAGALGGAERSGARLLCCLRDFAAAARPRAVGGQLRPGFARGVCAAAAWEVRLTRDRALHDAAIPPPHATRTAAEAARAGEVTRAPRALSFFRRAPQWPVGLGVLQLSAGRGFSLLRPVQPAFAQSNARRGPAWVGGAELSCPSLCFVGLGLLGCSFRRFTPAGRQRLP